MRSLFKFCKFGLLTEETSFILKTLSERLDWKYAEQKLFESGLVSSKNRASELRREISERFDITRVAGGALPELQDLMLIGRTKVSSGVKKEVYYVYLYYLDEIFARMVDFIRDIANNHPVQSVISRDDIKKMFIDYQKSIKSDPPVKTIDNWVGRFIRILKELNIFIKKAQNQYIINFGGVNRETWIFFTLWAFLKNKPIIDSVFLKPFNLVNPLLTDYVTKLNVNCVNYKIVKYDNQKISVEVTTNYTSLKDWIIDLK